MLCQRKISNRGFKLKVKRSNERICLAISQSSVNKRLLELINGEGPYKHTSFCFFEIG